MQIQTVIFYHPGTLNQILSSLDRLPSAMSDLLDFPNKGERMEGKVHSQSSTSGQDHLADWLTLRRGFRLKSTEIEVKSSTFTLNSLTVLFRFEAWCASVINLIWHSQNNSFPSDYSTTNTSSFWKETRFTTQHFLQVSARTTHILFSIRSGHRGFDDDLNSESERRRLGWDRSLVKF